jgi:hypothetical protein
MPGERRGAGRWRRIKLNDGKHPGLVPVWLHLAGEAEALARSYAELSFRAIWMLMAFVMEVVEGAAGPLFSTLATTGKLAPLSCAGPSVPSWVRPPTGEPDAGDLPVRFGGRGRRQPLPSPINEMEGHVLFV